MELLSIAAKLIVVILFVVDPAPAPFVSQNTKTGAATRHLMHEEKEGVNLGCNDSMNKASTGCL